MATSWLRPKTALLPSLLICGSLIMGACGSSGDQVGPPIGQDEVTQDGYQLVQARNCTSCHSDDGASRSGPTWKGLAGSEVVLRTGQTVTVDDEYLRRAIVDPDADIREDYRPGIMSNFTRNQEPLSEAQVQLMVDYIKTL